MVAAHAGQRTTVIVAHRLSTVQKCDFIVVLSKGVVAESGSHDVLLQKKQVPCPSIFLFAVGLTPVAAVLEAGSRAGHLRMSHHSRTCIYMYTLFSFQ